MKKNSLKVLFILSMLLIILASTSASASIKGTGSAENPFIITTQDELLLVSDFPSYHFVLGNDIELSGDWTPLCIYSNAFTGTFDGQGYTISNLQIKNFINSGLFAANSGTIRNLNVVTTESGISFNSSSTSTVSMGILTASNTGVISECNVTGNVHYSNATTSGKYTSYLGEICGKNSGIINKSTSLILIENIDAYNYRYNYGYGSVYVGGIAGDNSSSIERCISKGNISISEADNSLLGGIAGACSESAIVSLCQSDIPLNDGYSHTRGFVGGITGQSSAAIIDHCYYIGSLAGANTGGIVGYGTAEISDCYAASIMSASTKSGIGGQSSGTNSFYDQTLSGATDTGYGFPKSTLAMKMKLTYENANWDFENVWGMDENINNGYPYLLFEYDTTEQKNNIIFNKTLQNAIVTVPTDGTYSVIFADYNDNSFVDTDIQTITLKSGENIIPTALALSGGDKIFVWKNSISSMTPLCEAEIIR